VVLEFIIGIHKKDHALLESIKAFFDNIGIISKNGECFNYTVTKINDIAKIIEHFDKYPLITTHKNLLIISYLNKHLI